MKNLVLDNQERLVISIIKGERPFTDGYTKGRYSFRESRYVDRRRTKLQDKAIQSLINREIIAFNPESKLLTIIQPELK